MQTALHTKEKALGARFVHFSGFELPLLYSSILNEHKAVREHAGLFDISNMGRIAIQGKETLPFLDSLSANQVVGAPFKKALYTIFCDEKGCPIDDLMLFIESNESAFAVANGANREKVLHHLQKQSEGTGLKVEPSYATESILALQGPESFSLISGWAPALSLRTFTRTYYREFPLILSRTGYTGEEGYEIFGAHAAILDLFQNLIEKGAVPCGLGARDLLRLEMGYALFGHEIGKDISPIESVASWCVKLKGRSFLGSHALEKLLQSGRQRRPAALIGTEKSIARENAPVLKDGEKIGFVTSGSFSPSLNKPIALALLDRTLAPYDQAHIEIRGHPHPFLATSLPFYRK